MTTPPHATRNFAHLGFLAKLASEGLVLRNPRGFTFIVKPIFLLLVGLMALVSHALLQELTGFSFTIAGETHRLGPPALPLHALGFTLCYFASVITHELGHALAYRLQGERWLGLELALGAGVWAASSRRTVRQQFFITLLGPLLQLVVCAGGLLLALPHYELFWLKLALATGVFDALVNLTVPLSRKSDGAKLWHSLWLLARGRGNELFYAKI